MYLTIVLAANPLITPHVGMMFWTLLTFVLLLIVLRAFAWKPIMSGLRSREESIEKALNEAKNAREEMKKLTAENEVLLNKARAERDVILKEARETKDKLIAESRAQAQEEGRRLIAIAKDQINQEKESAMRQLREEVVSLSMEAASKILKRQLSNPQEQEALIASYLNEPTATVN